MKAVLIPTDFSDNAGDALDYALHLFAKSACRLHIVNVVDVTVVPSEIPVSNVDIIGPRIEDARSSMEALKGGGGGGAGSSERVGMRPSGECLGCWGPGAATFAALMCGETRPTCGKTDERLPTERRGGVDGMVGREAASGSGCASAASVWAAAAQEPPS